MRLNISEIPFMYRINIEPRGVFSERVFYKNSKLAQHAYEVHRIGLDLATILQV
jgi:hypothetical protein